MRRIKKCKLDICILNNAERTGVTQIGTIEGNTNTVFSILKFHLRRMNVEYTDRKSISEWTTETLHNFNKYGTYMDKLVKEVHFATGEKTTFIISVGYKAMKLRVPKDAMNEHGELISEKRFK